MSVVLDPDWLQASMESQSFVTSEGKIFVCEGGGGEKVDGNAFLIKMLQRWRIPKKDTMPQAANRVK